MRRTHGRTNSRQYRIWATMLTRCNNRNRKDYSYYGGRGISVCKEWKSADAFLSWCDSSGYSDDLQLDRIDNSIGYSPSNCRWVTRIENGANKRNNHFVFVDGKKMTIAQLANMLSLDWHVVYKRTMRGWSGEDIIAGRRTK